MILPLHHGMAWPGDPDLNMLIGGAVITAVTVYDREVSIMLRGGHGYWDGADTDDGTAELEEMVGCMQADPTASDFAFEAYVTRLEAWRDAGTRVVVAGAPGKRVTVTDENGHFLPLGRLT